MSSNVPAAQVNPPKQKSVEASGDVHGHAAHNQRFSPIKRVSLRARRYSVDFLGESVGTFMFLFSAFSATQVPNYTNPGASVSMSSDTSNILLVALAFGFSLAVNARVFFRITGGPFNPAVPLGIVLIGNLSWNRGLIICIAQMVGAIAGAAIVSGLFPGDMAVQTSLHGGATVAQGLSIEMFFTAELVFSIFMMAEEEPEATFVAPIGIGLAMFICELPGVHYTGGSLNPARSFAPAVINGNCNSYPWIYWLGPF